jgi:anti-sigma regulatory factor (Ser/Thr protein kinase)
MSSSEADRLAALQRYQILDTAPEQAFDDLALLASQICGTPIATITLIDADRQWFKARIGIPVQETPRSISFCARAIGKDELFVIPDARDDERFRDNPFVTGEPRIRFYAGAPLLTPDGFALGTLCVADVVPRTLTPGQTRALDALRRQVQAQLALRANLRELEGLLAERDRADAEQVELIAELRSALDKVGRLSALVPLSSTCQFNIVIPADPAAIPRVMDGVLQMLQGKHWTDTEIMKVELALQEALANGIRHGCQGDPTKHIQCCITLEANGEVLIVVRDPGDGFDERAVANPLDEANMLKPSGRGIFLINELMDEVAFRDGGREVQMRKRRDG